MAAAFFLFRNLKITGLAYPEFEVNVENRVKLEMCIELTVLRMSFILPFNFTVCCLKSIVSHLHFTIVQTQVSMSLSGLSKSKRLKLEKSAREKAPALELEAVDDRMSQDEEMFYCDHPQTERTPTKDDVEDRSAPTRRAYRERARSSSSSGKSSSVPAQTDRRGRSRRSLPKSYQAYEK